MKASFDELKNTIVSAGKDMGQKAKDVSEMAKLRLDIRSKEDFLEKQYAILGSAYYETHKDDEESEEAEQFAVIREAIGEVEAMKQQLLSLKGNCVCPSCGAKMPEGAVFCYMCGKKMEEDVFEEE